MTQENRKKPGNDHSIECHLGIEDNPSPPMPDEENVPDTVNSYLLPSEDEQTRIVIEENEEELARLRRWQQDLRAEGKVGKAEELEDSTFQAS